MKAAQALRLKGSTDNDTPAPAPAVRRTLVKSRPASLEQRYTLLDHTGLGDEAFRRLQRRLFAAIDRHQQGGGSTVFRETGRLAPGRPYFYIKPQSGQGWLFERSGAGWVITPAEKIVARDLFLRGPDPLDSVALYHAQDRAAVPRVKSRAAGDDLLALAVYEGRLLSQLGLP